MSRSILVTGGAGFIGANLVPYLLERDFSVSVYDNLSRGRREFLDGYDVEFMEGDILDLESLEKAFRGRDGVIHLAAYGSVIESIEDPLMNFEINARGVVNVLTAARDCGVGQVLFASTGGALIGDAEPPVDESSLPKPISPYGAGKLVGEGYMHAFAKSYGMRTTALRFANVYGPVSAHKKGALTVFIKAIMSNRPITIYGDGSASRDFLFVSDLCAGIERALSSELTPGCVFHLASGRETSIKELALRLCAVAGCPDFAIEYEPARRGEVLRNFADFSLARKQLGFEPKVSLDEGLAATWEWFQARGARVLGLRSMDS